MIVYMITVDQPNRIDFYRITGLILPVGSKGNIWVRIVQLPDIRPNPPCLLRGLYAQEPDSPATGYPAQSYLFAPGVNMDQTRMA